MLGYFDDQESTENSFNKSGWFMTGDLGSLDADGYLRITGRKKDVIIRGGHNILPGTQNRRSGVMRHAAIDRGCGPGAGQSAGRKGRSRSVYAIRAISDRKRNA